ncbi:HupK protein [Paracoccus sp. p4-l81]|uniref:HupK protein n=1 Tax=unclassified Paracoccus (in: a-proteobacteria) TaxID=2688777 RepID=UPI0035B7F318
MTPLGGLTLDWRPMGPARITLRRSLPVEALLLGRPVDQAGPMLARLFNLCGAAQETGLRLALGLPAPVDALRADIIRDHMARLAVIWPRLLGLAVQPVKPPAAIDLPAPGQMAAWLTSGQGFAPLMAAIRAAVPRGDWHLPDPTPAALACRAACENTPAGRRADHPLLAGQPRDLFWRAMGRLVDLAKVLAGDLPPARSPAPGLAILPAARGAYHLRAAQVAGILTALDRITPTDHITAPGGLVERALSGLPDRAAADLALAILDPCLPVHLTGAVHA